MIQEILIPIVLKIQRAIRFWIYRRKYLPYLKVKRRRDKIIEHQTSLYERIQAESHSLAGFESYKLEKTMGFELNLKMMPKYFVNL